MLGDEVGNQPCTGVGRVALRDMAGIGQVDDGAIWADCCHGIGHRGNEDSVAIAPDNQHGAVDLVKPNPGGGKIRFGIR